MESEQIDRVGALQDAYTPGYVRAAEKILGLIKESGLTPGDRLPTESELARTLGISQTVTREAVKVLSAVGKVSAQKGRGLYVSDGPAMFHESGPHFAPLEVDDVTALFEYRRLLEAELAGLAADRATPAEVVAIENALDAYIMTLEQGDFDANSAADDAFHNAVGDAAHNKFVRASAKTVRDMVGQSAIAVLRHVVGRQHRDAAMEHQSIYDAIQRGDATAAREAATAHIDRTLEDIRSEILRRVAGQSTA